MTRTMQNYEDHIADLKFIRQHHVETGRYDVVAQIDCEIQEYLSKLEEDER